MNIRNTEASDVAHPLCIEQWTIDFQSSQGIWSVEYDYFLTAGKTCFHGGFHCADKSITARADILQIDDHCIDVLKLTARWHEIFGFSVVERKHGESGASIDLIWKGSFRRLLVVEPVFNGVERNKF